MHHNSNQLHHQNSSQSSRGQSNHNQNSAQGQDQGSALSNFNLLSLILNSRPSPSAHLNSHSNSHLNAQLNLHQNSHQNQHANAHLNQSSNQYLNQSSNQYLNQSSNQYLNQSSNQYLNQSSNQYLNQSSNQYLNQSSNQYLNQSSNQYLIQSSNQYLNQNPNQQLIQNPNQQLNQNPNQQLNQNPNQQLNPNPNQQLNQNPNQQLNLHPNQTPNHHPNQNPNHIPNQNQNHISNQHPSQHPNQYPNNSHSNQDLNTANPSYYNHNRVHTHEDFATWFQKNLQNSNSSIALRVPALWPVPVPTPAQPVIYPVNFAMPTSTSMPNHQMHSAPAALAVSHGQGQGQDDVLRDHPSGSGVMYTSPPISPSKHSGVPLVLTHYSSEQSEPMMDDKEFGNGRGASAPESPRDSQVETAEIVAMVGTLGVKNKSDPDSKETEKNSDSNSSSPTSVIQEVWKYNLEEEFQRIRSVRRSFKYVAMDTEFPGVVYRSKPYSRESEGNQLDTIVRNVDALKLIQLGLSFFDEKGNSPPGTSTWQFNFEFDRETDESNEPSIKLLNESGVQFERLKKDGIDPAEFCYQMISSGLVLQSDIVWITFHGGYDFSYLFKLLRGQNLPKGSVEFAKLMMIYFPNRFDTKVILAGYPRFVGGLNDIAQDLGLQRVGTSHQAGSDSLLTGKVFFRIKEVIFDSGVYKDKLEEYIGKVYGLGLGNPTSLSIAHLESPSKSLTNSNDANSKTRQDLRVTPSSKNTESSGMSGKNRYY